MIQKICFFSTFALPFIEMSVTENSYKALLSTEWLLGFPGISSPQKHIYDKVRKEAFRHRCVIIALHKEKHKWHIGKYQSVCRNVLAILAFWWLYIFKDKEGTYSQKDKNDKLLI